MGAVKTFDPKKVIMTFGTNIISGIAEGTFVTIARSGNAFDKRKGSAGDVDRVNKNATDFTVTITLMSTSPTNDALSSALEADITTGLNVLPLSITDLSGTTVFFAESAWIEKDPDYEGGDSLPTRPWVFATGKAELHIGGNI